MHATEDEAQRETETMLEVYREFAEDVLAVPVMTGAKPDHERFPGAERSLCIEAMMQDRKALQAGTSHYLGQNFARGSGIQFVAENGEQCYAHTTSWGVSTRLIGAVIMTHGDDDGLRLPPRIAPKHIVVLPVIPKPELQAQVLAYAEEIAQGLRAATWAGRALEVHVDKRDMRGGEKNWQWIKKGIPLRIEVGPRDMEARAAMVYRRDRPHKERSQIAASELAARVPEILADMQSGYYRQAREFRDKHIERGISNLEEFKQFFTPKNAEKPEIHGGFVLAKWSGDPKTEEILSALKVTVRCIPTVQSGTAGTCVLTGKPATVEAIFAKAY